MNAISDALMSYETIIFNDWEIILKAEMPVKWHCRYRDATVLFRQWLRETGIKPDEDNFKAHLMNKVVFVAGLF